MLRRTFSSAKNEVKCGKIRDNLDLKTIWTKF